MSTIDLDALERIAQAATPGPWETGEVALWGDDRDIPQAAVLASGSPLTWDDHSGEVFDPVNAEHIAAFDPPTVLALIARVRELEAIVNDGGNQAAKYWTRLTAAERERDDIADRLSELLCNLTDGRMSKTNYTVKAMVAEVEDVFDQAHQAEVQTLANGYADLVVERDRYRNAIEKALAFEAVLPAIATEPRRILTRALNDKEAEK